jgi:hypothetical protein
MVISTVLWRTLHPQPIAPLLGKNYAHFRTRSLLTSAISPALRKVQEICPGSYDLTYHGGIYSYPQTESGGNHPNKMALRWLHIRSPSPNSRSPASLKLDRKIREG